MSEFIEVIDALKELNELLKQKQSPRPLKFWLLDYDVLELPLYVSYDKGEQIELASEKEKQSHNENILSQLHPTTLNGKIIDKSGVLSLMTIQAIQIMTETPCYYWKTDCFYSNPIFKALETNQQLHDELEQAKARIAELEKQLQGNKSENALFVLGAIMYTIKQMSKSNYTQASHYQFIIDNYESTGLSQSNFEKTVTNAKNFFLQKVNKKSK